MVGFPTVPSPLTVATLQCLCWWQLRELWHSPWRKGGKLSQMHSTTQHHDSCRGAAREARGGASCPRGTEVPHQAACLSRTLRAAIPERAPGTRPGHVARRRLVLWQGALPNALPLEHPARPCCGQMPLRLAGTMSSEAHCKLKHGVRSARPS